MPKTNILNEINPATGEPKHKSIPPLMRVHNSPTTVGMQLGVYPNSIRHWLLKNGWSYDKDSKRWTESKDQDVSSLAVTGHEAVAI